jgi:hypothetical protein
MGKPSKKKRNQRQRQRQEQEGPRLDPGDAFDLIDDDLPDGAYWAMMEEMTGMDTADLADWHQGKGRR